MSTSRLYVPARRAAHRPALLAFLVVGAAAIILALAGAAGARSAPIVGNFGPVDFPTKSVGYIATGSGEVMKTLNGGKTWFILKRPQKGPRSQSLVGIDFTSAATGVILSWAYAPVPGWTMMAYRTQDGGAHWQPTSWTGHAWGVKFGTSSVGWAVGRSDGSRPYTADVQRTTDGGSSWLPVVAPAGGPLTVVWARGTNAAWVAGADDGGGSGGYLAKTTNSGASWTTRALPAGDLVSGMGFVSAKIGVAVGQSTVTHTAFVMRTTNGGRTWKRRTLTGAYALWGVAFIGSKKGWAVGYREVGGVPRPTMYVTADGGKTWKKKAVGGTGYLKGVATAGTSRVCVTGYRSPSSPDYILWVSNDSGRHWAHRTVGTRADLTTVDFPSDSTGWTGGGSALLKSTDGGRSWAVKKMPLPGTLRDVFFRGTKTGWLAGQGIAATTNGGGSWVRQKVPTTETLRAVCFASGSAGWAVGDGGTILATTNGGRSWRKQASGTTQRLLDVMFVSANVGSAVGGDGQSIVLHTTDGGRTWTQAWQGTEGGKPLSGLDFVSPTTGWAVGGNGLVLGTTNGGAGWSPAHPSLFSHTRLSMSDATTGYAGGYMSGISKTTTSCVTWDWIPLISLSEPILYFPDVASRGQKVWVVGDGGTIFRSTDAGGSWQE